MIDFRKRMRASSSGKSLIILANDLDENKVDKLESRTLTNIKTLNKYLCAIKLNFHVILPLSKTSLTKINRAAHDVGLQTIADIKLNDIGNTNRVAIERLWECGFDAVIVNPIMGPKNLKELVETSHKDKHGVIALVHMSHRGAKLGYGLGVRDPITSQMLILHELFLKWSYLLHVDGVIVGATVPELITSCNKKIKSRCEIYSPGVGTQGGDPKKTLDAGADYLIIGRTILNSNDPISEAKKLQKLTLKS
ncbi:MAG: orotidine 5'-phosphate decarboxylase [Thaumarchaeota archaeon]|nr:MAG: orotidine 5'-phosphate decarboxylase [Nitrososphaerota archaeon]